MTDMLRDCLLLGGAAALLALAIALLRLALYLVTAPPTDIARAKREARERQKRRNLVRILMQGTRP